MFIHLENFRFGSVVQTSLESFLTEKIRPASYSFVNCLALFPRMNKYFRAWWTHGGFVYIALIREKKCARVSKLRQSNLEYYLSKCRLDFMARKKGILSLRGRVFLWNFNSNRNVNHLGKWKSMGDWMRFIFARYFFSQLVMFLFVLCFDWW